MNNLQWTILFLIAFFSIGMIWFAKTFIPEINITPKTAIISTENPTISQALPTTSDGPKVTIVGAKKPVVVPIAKQSYTPARDIKLNTISNYRIQNGRKVLVFSDGSETFLTDDEYKQLPPEVRLRFEYRQGKP